MHTCVNHVNGNPYFWRVFRTSVIVFDFRTNYGKSVLVGSSVIGAQKVKLY